MGTIKSKYDIGLHLRRANAGFYNQLVQTHSVDWDLVFVEPKGANNYLRNRKFMGEIHGEVTRHTGDLGLTYECTLSNRKTQYSVTFKAELIFHRTYGEWVQIKTPMSPSTFTGALSFAHERQYFIAWGGKHHDETNPKGFGIYSGKRINMQRLKIYHNKGDKNKAVANFTGLCGAGYGKGKKRFYRLSPTLDRYLTQTNNIVKHILEELAFTTED